MKLLYWAFAALLIVAAVLFALSNRQAVDVGFWPLPFFVPIPAFVLGLGAFAAGFLCGGLVVWLRSIGPRTRARMNARRAESLQREVDALQERLATTEAEVMPSAPVVSIPDAYKSLRKSASAG